MLQRPVAIVLAGASVWVAARFPIAPVLVLSAIVLYAALLFRRPWWSVALIPALLPVLDLAPWTGWYFLDGTDLMFMTTLSVLLWKLPAAPCGLDSGVGKAFWLLALSYTVSMIVGFLPLQPFDWNAFSSYYSHYNSLRVYKGFFWAGCLFPFLGILSDRGSGLVRPYIYGAMAGLFGALAVSLWERYIFSGLLDLNAYFRIVSTFSILHTGGGTIEGYFALILPLIYSWVMVARNKGVYLAAPLMAAAGIYAMFVTFSRAGVIALGISICVLATLIAVSRNRFRRGHKLLWIANTSVLLFMLASLYLASGHMQIRMRTWSQDLHTRSSHLSEAVSLMGEGWPHVLFGEGLGTFPRSFRDSNSPDAVTGSHRFVKEGENVYLRLIGGPDFYFDQRVLLTGVEPYTVRLRARMSSKKSHLTVFLCEKNLLYSFDCVGVELAQGDDSAQWRELSRELLPRVSEKRLIFKRPVVLSFAGPASGRHVDLDDISLTDAEGRELLSNGDFSRGVSRWFFQSDNHIAWHVKNLFVAIFFEQGIIGLAAFLAFSMFVFAVLSDAYYNGSRIVIGMIAAMSGFFILSASASFFDSPRLASLYYLLCGVILTDKSLETGETTEGKC